MKKLFKILLGISAIVLGFSCEKVIEPPKIEAKVNKTLLSVNETMIIDFAGSTADQIVVFPGDDMQNYDLRDKSNTGLVVNKKLFTYSYLAPGEYKVVCLASTAGDFAKDLTFDIYSFDITVIDNQTEIDKLSCPAIIRDEVFAKRFANDEWLMVLPRSVIYNNREQNIPVTQRLRFYIQSDSTKVLINGNNYSATATYNLSAPLNILVRSNFGTERPYKLFTINYPRFSSFKLAGVTGTLALDEFDYSISVMNVTLPAGTDVSNLIPEFTTYSADEKVYIGNTEQISEVSTVNFTQNVTYRLVSTLPTNQNMQGISTVNVKISFQ